MLQLEPWYREAAFIDVDKVTKALETLGYRYLGKNKHVQYENAQGHRIWFKEENMSPGVLKNIAKDLGLDPKRLFEFSMDSEAQKQYRRGELVIRDRQFLPPLTPQAPTQHFPDRKLEQVLQNAARGVLEGAPLFYALNAFLLQFGDPSKKDERQAALQRLQIDPEARQLVEMVLEDAKNKIGVRSASIVSEKWLSGHLLAAFGPVSTPRRKKFHKTLDSGATEA